MRNCCQKTAEEIFDDINTQCDLVYDKRTDQWGIKTEHFNRIKRKWLIE